MSVYALVICIVLAGQVVDSGDRYSISGEKPSSGGQFGTTDARESTESVVVPLGQPPLRTDGSSRVESAGTPVGNPYSSPPADSAQYDRTQPLQSVEQGGTTSPSRGMSAVTATPPSDRTTELAIAGVDPTALMRAMVTAPRQSRLAGQQVALADVVSGAASRDEQTQRIDAYWDLCSSVADYNLGLLEQAELRRLRELVSRVGTTWRQAESELAVRVGTSQRAAVASQHRLASLMGRGALLPLPADLPHCGAYHTRYEQIFANRPSAEAAELNELLPLRYEELKDAATAVKRAEQWLEMVADQRNEVSDGTGMLRALELLALRRRAFVQIARDYNRRIARYSELAAPGQLDDRLLIGMLIKTERQTSTATRPADPPPLDRRSESTQDPPPRTAADDWAPAGNAGSHRDEAIEPATAEDVEDPMVERSILVPPTRRQQQ